MVQWEGLPGAPGLRSCSPPSTSEVIALTLDHGDCASVQASSCCSQPTWQEDCSSKWSVCSLGPQEEASLVCEKQDSSLTHSVRRGSAPERTTPQARHAPTRRTLPKSTAPPSHSPPPGALELRGSDCQRVRIQDKELTLSRW
ncbi:hypothetical protein AGIG_G13803 [Arapaima gigas]